MTEIDEKVPQDQGGKTDSFIGEIKTFALSNRMEAAAALLVVLGVCIFVFNDYVGGAVIGLVAGLFLAKDIKTTFFKLIDIFKGRDYFKALMLGGIGACVLLAAPTLFLGALAGIGIKSLLQKD